MRRFLIHISIVALLLIGFMAFVLSRANGYSDSYYQKLSSPKQSNLIIGTSKAAQGLQPEAFKEIMGIQFYNYAFSNNTSPFGEIYLNSVKKKLDKTTDDQRFLLTVDPWSLSTITKSPENPSSFREVGSFVDNIKVVDRAPNYRYLLHYFDNQYYKILQNDSPAFLHDDGWLEVNLDESQEAMARRLAFTINKYKKDANNYQFSNSRLSSLVEMISFLSTYGEVYIVRLPVHPDIMAIEESVISDFNERITSAISHSTLYYDMTSQNASFKYIDGVHLTATSGRKVSSIIAKHFNETTFK